jgi:hypothetical protein
MRSTLLVAFHCFASACFAQDAPAKEKLRSEPPPSFVVFAQYGDLDQIFDGSVGSPDRQSSYPGSWCVDKGNNNGGQKRDTDNPSEKYITEGAFRLSGYPAFDPESVEFALLRVDVLYEPEAETITTESTEEFLFRRKDTCSGFGSVYYTKSLREALKQANQDRRQWVALTLDLVSGALQAQEIDAHGNPITDRLYVGLSVRNQWKNDDPRTKRYDRLECREVLQQASDGALEGLVRWSGKYSYVSLIVKARPPAKTRVVQISHCELRSGRTNAGGWQVLDETGEHLWKITPANAGDKHVVEFDLTYTLPQELHAFVMDGQRVRAAARLDFQGSTPGTTVGKFTISLRDPTREDSFVEIDTGLLAPSGIEPTRRSIPITELHKFVDDDGTIVVRYRHENHVKRAFGDAADAVLTLLPELITANNINQFRLTVEADQ